MNKLNRLIKQIKDQLFYKIVIAEDHQVVIDGLIKMLAHEDNLVVVKTITSILDILPSLHFTKPDILILDINMNRENTFDLVPKLRKDFPSLKIITFTSYDAPALKKEAKSIGIDGFLTKNVSQEKLITTIYSVLANKESIALSRMDKGKMVPVKDRFLLEQKLSPRELEIIKLVGLGHTSQQIGELLFISKQTVQWHRKNIIAKLE